MTTVAEATPAMAQEILDVLEGFRNPNIARSTWARLLEPPWRAPDEPFGWVLLDGARVVGFVATIHSTVEVAGRSERLCNVSSWIVEPAYRNHAIRLVLAAVRRPGCSYTNLTASRAAFEVFRRMGFVGLDRQAWVMPALPTLPAAWRGYRWLDPGDEFGGALEGADLRVFRDHRSLPVEHFVLESGAGRCYVVSTRRRFGRWPICHVHYIGDRALFLRFSEAFCWALARRHRTPLVFVEERLLAGARPRRAWPRPLAVPGMLKSASLQPPEVSNLYSELALLGV